MPVIHLVLLRLAPDSDAAAVFSTLAALRGVVPGLVAFSGGPQTSAEGLGAFTHAFSMTFESAAARDAYLPHPAHERAKAAVVAALAPGPDAVAVVDYEVA